MSGPSLIPTPEFHAAGSTDKAHKSFYVGNALCGHSAHAELGIPWLLDIECLETGYNVTRSPGSKMRPDFLGLDTHHRWFIFESKGRSARPGKSHLRGWKTQASVVTHINGSPVTHNIVSAAFVNSYQQWELLWIDPPAETEEARLEVDEPSFFDAYYQPVIELIESAEEGLPGPDGPMSYVASLGAYLGLHRDIADALQRRESSAIIAFAQGRSEERQAPADVDSDATEVAIFPDGVMVRLAPGWNLKQGSTEPIQSRSEAMNYPTNIGQSERATQNRIIALFRDELHYRYLGDWTDRDNNSNIEDELLTAYLTRSGYSSAQIGKAIFDLRTEANHHTRGLYGNNKEVYKKLRYGIPVKIEAGKVTETVKLIDWEQPEKNDFAIAEEVTLYGNRERRPDIVLYVNGIAVGVLELKNSRISIGDGIRQNISNQQAEFNAPFFSTVQFIFAGNDSEGLQYGTVGTPEKYFLRWKEDEQDDTRFKLDKYLLKMCTKDRLIELMHDFVLFDGGMKKLPRVHQYFGIKAAQKHVRERRGGIIWHTQGSGKSIVMVLLAKWILENRPHARVVIVTDRDELDKQIEGVFTESGEAIKRTSSGSDLMKQLGQARPRLLCSLVHKFGRKGVDNFEQFIKRTASPTQPDRGRDLRLRRRMPPHAERQAAPRHEGDHAQRYLHRLHWHASAQEGQANQPRSLRRLHPHLQIQRSRAGRSGARSRIRSARHRPALGIERKDRRLVRRQNQGPERLAEAPPCASAGAPCRACSVPNPAWTAW